MLYVIDFELPERQQPGGYRPIVIPPAPKPVEARSLAAAIQIFEDWARVEYGEAQGVTIRSVALLSSGDVLRNEPKPELAAVGDPGVPPGYCVGKFHHGQSGFVIGKISGGVWVYRGRSSSIWRCWGGVIPYPFDSAEEAAAAARDDAGVHKAKPAQPAAEPPACASPDPEEKADAEREKWMRAARSVADIARGDLAKAKSGNAPNVDCEGLIKVADELEKLADETEAGRFDPERFQDLVKAYFRSAGNHGL